MVKLIRRVRKSDECAIYWHPRFGSWDDEDNQSPTWEALFCFPWSTTSESLNLDYFWQGARSEAGFETDSVTYTRPGSRLTHTYNPVTHFKLNGSILADEAPEERIELLGERDKNLLSSSKYVPVIPILPGQHYHYEFERIYYSSQLGSDVIFKGNIKIDRSKTGRFALVSNFGLYYFTIIRYTLLVGSAPYSDYKEGKRSFAFTGKTGTMLLFNPEGSSYPYRDVMWTYDINDNGYRYINKSNFGSVWHQLITFSRNAELDIKSTMRSHVPSTSRPSWVRFIDLERYSPLTNVGDIWLASNGVKIHPTDNQKALASLYHWDWSLYETFLHQSKDKLEWNHLCYNAMQNIGEGAQVNGIAFVKDAIEMGPTVKAFISTLRSLPSKRVKAVAAAWLAVHYGFKLTVLDSKELYSELTESKHAGFGLSNARSTRDKWINSNCHVTFRYQVIFDRFRNLTEVLNGFLRQIDFTLSLENIWDMIPFSFVVDWFVSVGDLFNAIDNFYNVRSYYTTAAAGQSITMKCPANILDKSVTDLGALEVSMYIRAYQRTPVLPIPSHTTVTPLSHWVEGAALIIANR